LRRSSPTLLCVACALRFALPLAAEEPRPRPAKPSLDGRRTLRRLVPNYGLGLLSVFSKDNVGPVLVTAGAAGVGAVFDDRVQRYFSAQRRARWLGDSGEQLGRPYVIAPMAVALLGVGRIDHHQSFRDSTYDIAEATMVAATYSTVLKAVVRRERPDGSNKLSFPSGHATNAFAWATVGAHYYGWKVGVPGYAVASLIGISRLEKNVHHLSDVLAGAGLGYISARSVMRSNSRPVGTPEHTAQLSFAPMTDPRGHGAGFRVSLMF
jgi:PAP2 superfamily